MNKEFLTCYFIAGPQNFPELSIEEAVEKIIEILESGVSSYQFRDKGTVYRSHNQRMATVLKLQEAAKDLHIPFIINDDLELACRIQADGVHLGQQDRAVAEAREKLGPQKYIGLSVRNKQEILAAQESEADYLGIGPIYPTSSKSDAAEPLGEEQLSQLLRVNEKAIIGIGGITVESLNPLSQMPLDGVAVISLLTRATNPQNIVRKIHTLF
ncbi:thiamine phosphate synthase [Lactococcus formosensis]|uniref:thiamine phosphate synthase n=1 Tax=Lactococcus formosensis TaxID=1281486 RepID=UPI0002F8F537|nr:thiamine phosphate synthase [Lactococcus formosensis]MCH1723518.1 thiamine phosphate synthase [Lactococcus formosensis]MDG6113364.1 thiamine phosphate synthase [Lactococcus formosensis]MDG6116523.1 thiamine phosphate synthase [Lactococcus formosensis]MDG6121599.1 thiamine phosphate synthase [Lactococcus formosensis]MDG6123161.1 thiamine phosphate synthase [Lactococcus formosensis]